MMSEFHFDCDRCFRDKRGILNYFFAIFIIISSITVFEMPIVQVSKEATNTYSLQISTQLIIALIFLKLTLLPAGLIELPNW